MKANETRLGYLVYKSDKLTIVNIDVLNEILNEEDKPESEQIFKYVLLSDMWLRILDFEKKVNPVNGRIVYTHYETGFKVSSFEGSDEFILGYLFKEKTESGELSYNARIVLLSDLFDLLRIVKRLAPNFKKDFLEKVEKDLEKENKEREIREQERKKAYEKMLEEEKERKESYEKYRKENPRKDDDFSF